MRLIFTLILVTCVPSVTQAQTTSYHIGNSLTNDSQPLGISAIAASRGLQHEAGYHIRSSSSMNEILTNPHSVSEPPTSFGTFTTALPNFRWDHVTLQPHDEVGGTLGLELQSILSFIDLTRSNPANSNTTFYLYQAWPKRGDYQTKWNATTPDNLNTPFAQTRDFYNHLFNRLRNSTDAKVLMIPVGEVLYELDVKMSNGEIPGFSSVSSLYRDTTHLTYSTGRFIAGLTTFSTLLAQYPNEIEKPKGFYDHPKGFTSEQSEIIFDTIRNVLNRHPSTGLLMPAQPRSDFDDNGVVDEKDLYEWQTSYGKEPAYDANFDGVVDGRDFLIWQRNYYPSFSAELLNTADLNNDGFLNNQDIQHWQEAYSISSGGDLDGDGDTDGADFLRWIRLLPSLQGDSNKDYLVNEYEFQQWQNSYGFNIATDADGDGIISGRDFLTWQREYRQNWTFPFATISPLDPLHSASASQIPEPSTSVLLVLFAISESTFFLRRI